MMRTHVFLGLLTAAVAWPSASLFADDDDRSGRHAKSHHDSDSGKSHHGNDHHHWGEGDHASRDGHHRTHPGMTRHGRPSFGGPSRGGMWSRSRVGFGGLQRFGHMRWTPPMHRFGWQNRFSPWNRFGSWSHMGRPGFGPMSRGHHGRSAWSKSKDNRGPWAGRFGKHDDSDAEAKREFWRNAMEEYREKFGPKNEDKRDSRPDMKPHGDRKPAPRSDRDDDRRDRRPSDRSSDRDDDRGRDRDDDDDEDRDREARNRPGFGRPPFGPPGFASPRGPEVRRYAKPETLLERWRRERRERRERD